MRAGSSEGRVLVLRRVRRRELSEGRAATRSRCVWISSTRLVAEAVKTAAPRDHEQGEEESGSPVRHLSPLLDRASGRRAQSCQQADLVGRARRIRSTARGAQPAVPGTRTPGRSMPPSGGFEAARIVRAAGGARARGADRAAQPCTVCHHRRDRGELSLS